MQRITWTEVWEAYRQLEEERWREHYRERGFDTWSAWRREYVVDFGLEQRSWTLESLADPITTIPSWLVGAYKGWRQYYPEGKTIATFSDIAQHPGLRENRGVQYALAHVEPTTRLIVFRCGEDIVVRDGTHRCAAIALRAADGLPYPGRVEMVVAHFDPLERALFETSFDQQFAKTVEK